MQEIKLPKLLKTPRLSFSEWTKFDDATAIDFVKNNTSFTAPDYFVPILAGHLPFALYQDERNIFRRLLVDTKQQRFAFPRLFTDMLMLGRRGEFPANFNATVNEHEPEDLLAVYPALFFCSYKVRKYEADGIDLIIDRYEEQVAYSEFNTMALCQFMFDAKLPKLSHDYGNAVLALATGMNCQEAIDLNSGWAFACDAHFAGVPYDKWSNVREKTLELRTQIRSICKHFILKALVAGCITHAYESYKEAHGGTLEDFAGFLTDEIAPAPDASVLSHAVFFTF